MQMWFALFRKSKKYCGKKFSTYFSVSSLFEFTPDWSVRSNFFRGLGFRVWGLTFLVGWGLGLGVGVGVGLGDGVGDK